MKVIDLSGYSFTGKGAYNNLFAEFKTHHTHLYEFEFDIIRTQGGIIDLYTALVERWSPVRSSEAIRDFKKIVRSYSGEKTFFDRLTTGGRHYGHIFPGFNLASQGYIDSLVDTSWRGQWPFAFDQTSGIQMLVYKVLYNIGFKDIFEDDIYLSAPTDREFKKKTIRYLYNILSSNTGDDISTIVMNNAFEPFDPSISMQFFDYAKSIVIDRDPRDIYMAAWDYTNKDGSKGWKATLGSDIEGFIQRYKLYRDKINHSAKDNILRITFEKLVLDYENTLGIIFDFIEEDRTIHTNKKKYFDPDISKKGVGMWKNADGQLKKDIEKIQSELKEYCKDY